MSAKRGKSFTCPICEKEIKIVPDNFDMIDEETMGRVIQQHVPDHKLSEIIEFAEQVMVDLTREAFYKGEIVEE